MSAKWDEQPLAALTTKIGSGSTPTGGRASYLASGIPFIRSMNVGMRQFLWEGLAYIDPATHQAMPGTQVQPSDVLLTITGAFRVACVPPELGEANVSQHVAILRPTAALHPRYLMYWLSQPAMQSHFQVIQKGATRDAITKAQIAALRIPLPPLAEQRRIVARVDELAARIAEARGLRRAALAEGERLPVAALAQFARQIACAGHVGDVLLARPRNGWSAKCTDGTEGTPVLSLSAVTGFRYRRTAFKRTLEPTHPGAHYWLAPGDLLLTRSNTPELVGHAAIYDGVPSPCIYPDLIMRLEVNGARAQPAFLWWWLRSPLVRTYIKQEAKGTSASMCKLSQEIVMQIPFPTHLPLAEQRRIVAYLDGVQAQADELKRLHAESAAELDALLPAVLDRAWKGEW